MADEKRLQCDQIDNALDLSNEDFDDVLQDTDMFPVRSLRMADRYVEGRVVIIAHVRIIAVEFEDRFCLTVYRRLENSDCRGGTIGLNTNVSTPGVPGGYCEKPMLVRVIEVGEQGQKGRETLVDSVVRLQSLDLCLARSAERPEPPIPSGAPLLLFGDEGELKVSPFRRGISSAVPDSNCVDRMIESGTKIVKAVPGDQRPMIQRRGISDADCDAVALTIDLFGDDIGIAVLPRVHPVEINFQVFFGTADFEDGISELRTDHAINS